MTGLGAVAGATFGLGAVLVVRSRGERRAAEARERRRPLVALLAAAGVAGVRPRHVVVAGALLGTVVALLVGAVARVPAIGLAFGGFASMAPVALLRARARRRAADLRAVWPEVVDNLASGIRAGLSLPEAVAAIGERGPEVTRPAFAAFAADFRATGDVVRCLDRLAERLADPVGDRVVEALRLAREVGGTDLGRLLRTLSAFLRADLRTRAEIEARQAWTVSAARLALAAPWLLLLLLSTRPAAVAAYRTGAGVTVLAVGGGVSLLAYRLMLRVARLPVERRRAP